MVAGGAVTLRLATGAGAAALRDTEARWTGPAPLPPATRAVLEAEDGVDFVLLLAIRLGSVCEGRVGWGGRVTLRGSGRWGCSPS